MRILKCYIKNFGCYSNQEFDFNNNLNPYFLKNGSGKTTLSVFIKSMFYSLEKNSKTSYERKHYTPYKGGIYGGSIDILLNDTKYHIERTFGDTKAKDTLKIYDENGNLLSKFKDKDIKADLLLGELIFGIDENAFTRCNFISSSDLDFTNNESIKMKIGNVIIDKDKENTFEDTYKAIKEFDLREKKPTSKNEPSYPFQISNLEKINKEKQNEIEQLNKLEESLTSLYEQRLNIKCDLSKTEEALKAFAKVHEKKGKMDVVRNYENEISKQDVYINHINDKYHNNILTNDEIKYLNDNISSYLKYYNINESLEINDSIISNLNNLENKIIKNDDIETLDISYQKLSNITDLTSKIDKDRLKHLEAKFLNKELKDENTLQKEYIGYKTLEASLNSFDENYKILNKEYPSERLLSQIESEIKEYNNQVLDLDNFKASHKEIPIILKILLIIITFGIYLIVLNNNKTNYLNTLKDKENKLNNKKNELDNFFNKYDKMIGSYELRLNELKDDIKNYENLKNDNLLKEKQKQELSIKINNSLHALLHYFSYFGYLDNNLDKVYLDYKNDLKEYLELKKEDERNNAILLDINNKKKLNNDIIINILNKYQITKKDDFEKQLKQIKEDAKYYNKYYPLYLQKLNNEKVLEGIKLNIFNLLNNHNIYDNSYDEIFNAKKAIKEIEDYHNSKDTKLNLITKKDKFIIDNNLTNFNLESIEEDETLLRKEHNDNTIKLDDIESKIKECEENIARKEILADEINKNLELIEEYKEKIKIASLALNLLTSAQSEMEAKFIGPVKNSFVNYANKIYEKIALNVDMNYDYEIKYKIEGTLRDAKDLSAGERAIMMLALRFSILDSLYKDHDSVIILDDPFESLDDEKLQKAKELIKELSRKWQIIYFTCHESRKI